MKNNKKIKILALYGPSGAGKHEVLEQILKKFPVHKTAHVSTKIMVSTKEEYFNCHYIPVEMFTKKVLSGQLIEATADTEDNFFGTDIAELVKDKVNVGIFSPDAIDILLDDSRLEVFPVYVDAPEKSRLLRMINRSTDEECYSVCKKFLKDDADYSEADNFGGGYINNETWSEENIEQAVKMFLEALG